MPSFVSSSRDVNLVREGLRRRSRLVTSSSASTGLMSHLYFLFSNFKPPDTSAFTPGFRGLPSFFNFASLIPSSVVLRPRHGGRVWGVDSHPKLSNDASVSSLLVTLGAVTESTPPMLFCCLL